MGGTFTEPASTGPTFPRGGESLASAAAEQRILTAEDLHVANHLPKRRRQSWESRETGARAAVEEEAGQRAGARTKLARSGPFPSLHTDLYSQPFHRTREKASLQRPHPLRLSSSTPRVSSEPDRKRKRTETAPHKGNVPCGRDTGIGFLSTGPEPARTGCTRGTFRKHKHWPTDMQRRSASSQQAPGAHAPLVTHPRPLTTALFGGVELVTTGGRSGTHVTNPEPRSGKTVASTVASFSPKPELSSPTMTSGTQASTVDQVLLSPPAVRALQAEATRATPGSTRVTTQMRERCNESKQSLAVEDFSEAFEVVTTEDSRAQLLLAAAKSSAIVWRLIGGDDQILNGRTRVAPIGVALLFAPSPPRATGAGAAKSDVATQLCSSETATVSYFLPLGDASLDGDSIDAWQCLCKLLEVPGVRKVCWHVQSSLRHVFSNVADVKPVCLYCPKVAAWMMAPDSPQSALSLRSVLRAECVAFSDVPGIDPTTDGFDSVDGITAVLGPLLSTAHRQFGKLQTQTLSVPFEALEMPLALVLARMELRGLRFDASTISMLEAELNARLLDLGREAHVLGGRVFSVSSPIELASVLFDELQLDVPPSLAKTKTERRSTNEAVLESLISQHDLPAKVLQWRKTSKVLSTYVKPLLHIARSRFAEGGRGGAGRTKHCSAQFRIHSSFHLTRTGTGRLSSSDPNVQQLPTKFGRSREVGVNIRAAFKAARGWKLLSVDYAAIEMRVLAHMCHDADAGRQSFMRVFSEPRDGKQDIYETVACVISNCKHSDLAPRSRAVAKMTLLGIIYGMGSREASRRLKVSEREAANVKRLLLSSFPAISSFMNRARECATSTGFVETISGRRRYLPGARSHLAARRAQAERQAVNAIIQGTAADIVSAAAVLVDERVEATCGARLVAHVHDELLLEVPDDQPSIQRTVRFVTHLMTVEVVKHLKRISARALSAKPEHLRAMWLDPSTDSVAFSVPLAVHTTLGNDWGNMSPFEV